MKAEEEEGVARKHTEGFGEVLGFSISAMKVKKRICH